jgi:hypothetical protein
MTSATNPTPTRWGSLVVLAWMTGAMGCVPASNAVMDAGGSDRVDAPATVTYTKDVQPIFKAKCSPCHADQELGHHNLATRYADAFESIESLDSYGCWNDSDSTMFTMPKKVGECALVLIMNGRMPSGAGCGGTMPEDPSKCLSADQKAAIAAWVAAGMPQ